MSVDNIIPSNVDEPRCSNCTFQPEEPVGSATFIPSDDDSAGVFLESFIERNHDGVKSYLPLKLEKVVQIGDPSREVAVLQLITDCATIELCLVAKVDGPKYHGRSVVVSVTHEGQQQVYTEPLVTFKRYIHHEEPRYNMSWTYLRHGPQSSLTTVYFKQFGFIMNSSDVTYKYLQKIRNEVGFRGNWI